MTARRLVATVCHLSDTRLQHCLSPFLSVDFVSFPFQRLCFRAPRYPGFCVVFKIVLLRRFCRTNEPRPVLFRALLINARDVWQNLASKREVTPQTKLIFHETGVEKVAERNSVRNSDGLRKSNRTQFLGRSELSELRILVIGKTRGPPLIDYRNRGERRRPTSRRLRIHG